MPESAAAASTIANTRDEWERIFNICWGGVYLNTSCAFLPISQKADLGHIVNTSSINGFWATIGPTVAHTAYARRNLRSKALARR